MRGSVGDEPIAHVLARLAVVPEVGAPVAVFDRWLVDASRAAGWFAVTRAEVEAGRWEAWLASLLTPVPDAGGGEDADADPAPDPDADPGPDPDAGAGAGAGGPGPALSPGPSAVDEPEPVPARPLSAREQARAAKLAKVLRRFPAFRGLLEHGRVTEDHVLALDAVRNLADARARVDEAVDAALQHSAEGFAAWLRVFDATIDLERDRDTAARLWALRSLRLFERRGELGEFRGELPPHVFDAFKRSLEAIDSELRRRGDDRAPATYAQRMADALVEMMHRAAGRSGAPDGERAPGDDHAGPRTASHGADAVGAGSVRTAVVVLVHLDDLLRGTGHGVAPDGTPIDIGDVRRLAAREHVIPMVLGADSVPLDLGRAQRYATDAQWLALLARDGGCVLCDAPLGPLDAHHAPPWARGGRSDLAGMCLLCRRCHRRVHAERITLRIDGATITATLPDGTRVPTAPPGTGRAHPPGAG